jgi:hypothetical protein
MLCPISHGRGGGAGFRSRRPVLVALTARLLSDCLVRSAGPRPTRRAVRPRQASAAVAGSVVVINPEAASIRSKPIRRLPAPASTLAALGGRLVEGQQLFSPEADALGEGVDGGQASAVDGGQARLEAPLCLDAVGRAVDGAEKGSSGVAVRRRRLRRRPSPTADGSRFDRGRAQAEGEQLRRASAQGSRAPRRDPGLQRRRSPSPPAAPWPAGRHRGERLAVDPRGRPPGCCPGRFCVRNRIGRVQGVWGVSQRTTLAMKPPPRCLLGNKHRPTRRPARSTSP